MREFLDIFEDVCSLHTCVSVDSFRLLHCITLCECSGRFFLRHPVYISNMRLKVLVLLAITIQFGKLFEASTTVLVK